MKKAGLIILGIIILFLIIVYISVNTGPEKNEISVLVDIENVNDFDFKTVDSVKVSASYIYNANELKKLMQGEHYRESWSTPIKVPVVFLDTLDGGLVIEDVGGGKQTKSLELEAKNGTVYTLRSINKDPSPLISDMVKNIGLENLIIDGISAQHPYGAIPSAALSNYINIEHTHPKIVFIPKQKVLGEHNEDMGNKLYLLEYEPEGDYNWPKKENFIEVMDTDHMLEYKIEKDTPVLIDKEAFIRQRLFDMLIGDWDRHAKQWGWIMTKKDSAVVAIPMACDRDNAFFDVEGVIPNIISNPAIKERLRSFEEHIDYMPGLVMDIDRYFLIQTDLHSFTEQAKFIQQELTNERIDKALKTWPEPIRKLDAKTVKKKIIARRDNLEAYAINFKKIIDEKGICTDCWPLKGCEEIEVNEQLKICFDCDTSIMEKE